MWAIAAYYNPARYRRRLANYKAFRRRLHLPLVTVELGYDGSYELTNDDADVLIQIGGGAVLWQKERLLNLALDAVPAAVETIAWLDCDVVFDRADWIEDAQRRLTALDVIQLFSQSAEFKAEALASAVLSTDNFSPGVASLFAESNLPLRERWQSIQKIRPKHFGYAWAAKRSLLRRHGFYDAAILGGADGLMFLAMYGLFDEAIIRSSLNAKSQIHYLRWARSFHEAVGHRVGYMPGKIYHLWHGDRQNRKYRHRYQLLRGFDPGLDIVLASTGVWRWRDPGSELAEKTCAYFQERLEDDTIMNPLSVDPTLE